MSNFSKKTKQRIIDDYLQKTGANMFVPTHFVDWLVTQPEHEAYPEFYAMDDIMRVRIALIWRGDWRQGCVLLSSLKKWKVL